MTAIKTEKDRAKNMDNETLEAFTNLGMAASFHYADDTGSGEWRLGSTKEAQARKLFADNLELQTEMTQIAKRFLWTL